MFLTFIFVCLHCWLLCTGHVLCDLNANLDIASHYSDWQCYGNVYDEDICEQEWEGIDCSVDNVVTGIHLPGLSLRGTLPSTLGGLDSLSEMSLRNNSLYSSVPSALGLLQDILCLDLGDNQLSGSIPLSLQYLQNLKYLDLSQNKLSGSISSFIYGLSHLQYLDLSHNKLGGSIPTDVTLFASYLSHLDLSSNSLTSSIPRFIFGLSYFAVSYNNITGTIPQSLYPASSMNLITLLLNNNQISGSVPISLCLGNLTQLSVDNNELLVCYSNCLTTLLVLTRGTLGICEKGINYRF